MNITFFCVRLQCASVEMHSHAHPWYMCLCIHMRMHELFRTLNATIFVNVACAVDSFLAVSQTCGIKLPS